MKGPPGGPGGEGDVAHRGGEGGREQTWGVGEEEPSLGHADVVSWRDVQQV